MTIAAERYLAVCHPFKHSNFTEKKILLIFALINIMSFLLNSITTVEVSIIIFGLYLLNNDWS